MLFVQTDVIRAGSCQQAGRLAPGTCTRPRHTCLPALLHWSGFPHKASECGKYGKRSFWEEVLSSPVLAGHPHLQSWAAWSNPFPWAARIALSWVPATFSFTAAQRAAKYLQQKGGKSPPMACNILSSLKKHLGQSRLF